MALKEQSESRSVCPLVGVSPDGVVSGDSGFFLPYQRIS